MLEMQQHRGDSPILIEAVKGLPAWAKGAQILGFQSTGISKKLHESLL